MPITILGVQITNLQKTDILERIQNLFSLGKQILVVTPNPEMLVLAQKDREFKALLNSAEVALPDGAGLSLAARLQGEKMVERITGVDFLIDAVEWAKKNNLTIYLLGGKNGAGEGTKQWLATKFRGVEIQTNEEEFINNPQKKYVVFVALGHGRQERKSRELLNNFPNIFLAMGVGGAFDFLSGQIPRAPKFMRVLGLEWLFRLRVEPWRIGRIWKATVVFMYYVFRDKYHKNKI